MFICSPSDLSERVCNVIIFCFHAHKQTSKQASKQARKQASKQASKQTNKQTNNQTNIRTYIHTDRQTDTYRRAIANDVGIETKS